MAFAHDRGVNSGSSAGVSSVSLDELRLIVEGIPYITWLTNPDRSTAYCNRAGRTYAGSWEDSDDDRDWMSLVRPDDADRAGRAWEHASRTQTPFRTQARLRRVDGEYLWHSLRGHPLSSYDAGAKWVITATDIEDTRAAQKGRRAAERTAAETSAMLNTLLARVPVGLCVVDRDYRVVRLNETLAAVNGSTVAEQLGRTLAARLPELWPQLEPLYRGVLDRGETVVDVAVDGPSAASAGETHHWLSSLYPVWLDGEVTGVAVVVVDVTDRTRAEATRQRLTALVEGSGDAIFGAETERVHRAGEALFQICFEQAAIGSAITDLEGVALQVNPAFCAFFARPKHELIGRLGIEFSHPDEEPLARVVRANVAAGHDSYHDERRYLRRDGSVIWASTSVTLVRDETGCPQYFYTQLRDITERVEMEHELAHQAVHDSLTGLPNRVLLTDRLDHSLARSQRDDFQLGVIFVDLDNFKDVNDSLGHAAGDDLLRMTAERITTAVRPGDTVARFGGDEFVVVCDGATAVETEQIAERVLYAVRQPCLIDDQEATVTASAGIAIADDPATAESLLRDSDAAMHRAKQRGPAHIELFDAGLRSKIEQRLATTSALNHAIERDEMVVHYQPIVNLYTGALVGTEALLRWQHPERGLVSPAEFIPLAEESGLIVPIGAWVLEQACTQLAQWQQLQRASAAASKLSMSVNLSVRQVLAPGLVALVDDVLRRSGVRPGDVCLEVTESLFVEDIDYAEQILIDLKNLGVRLAIDDFGTGYSSLSYLKRLPVDIVKVDRSFVDGLGTDSQDSALVGAIIALADALGLDVTAEGVETADQLANLKRLNCRQAQGFYFARPMPADDVTPLVTGSQRLDVE